MCINEITSRVTQVEFLNSSERGTNRVLPPMWQWKRERIGIVFMESMEFFLNRLELSLNSVVSVNLINR